MDAIYAIVYQARKIPKAHEYLRYDAHDTVRYGYDAVGKGLKYGGRMFGLGVGYSVAVSPYAAWKLAQSLYYVGIKGIDRAGAGVVWGLGKTLRWASRNHTPDPTYNNLTGWLNWARPSRLRTVEGWTPYGFRANVPAPGGAGVIQGGWVAGWRWNSLPRPTWHGHRPRLPVRAAPDVFNPNEVVKGINTDKPESWFAASNDWLSKAVIQDTGTIGRSILTERFPAGHAQAGQPRFAALQPTFRVAVLADRAARLARAGGRHAAFALGLQAQLAARAAGFANAAEAVTARDAHLDHMLKVNSMNMTNLLQRDFERQEVQHVLKLVLKLHWKELWNYAKYGYMGYEGASKKQADLAHGRLLGLLQEVDPLHGRKQAPLFPV